MPSPTLRFPKTWRLPFGFVATIQRVTEALMKRRSGHAHRGYFTGWDPATHTSTIYINRDCPLEDQYDTLTHEMRHAVIDWESWVQDRRLEVFEGRLKTAWEAHHE